MFLNKKTIITLSSLLLVLVGSMLFFRFQKLQSSPISITGYKLNTVVEITIYDSDNEDLLSESLELCDKYEKLFSRTLEESELYQLNHRQLPQKNGGYLVSDETADLIQKGLEYCELSNGAFDITIEPVSALWDFTSGTNEPPSDESIHQALQYVNFKNVHVSGNTVFFDNEHTTLDLGAIAKGYIADRIKEFLLSKGVNSATINLGGNVLCIGDKKEGTPFSVGIQRPFADRRETIAIMEITDLSVVSSGIYERFFEKDGELFHHLLNPETGYPYENHLVSVSIVSKYSVDGDGLSTTCFALGLNEGLALLNTLDETEGFFITDTGDIYYTDDFENKISVTKNP